MRRKRKCCSFSTASSRSEAGANATNALLQLEASHLIPFLTCCLLRFFFIDWPFVQKLAPVECPKRSASCLVVRRSAVLCEIPTVRACSSRKEKKSKAELLQLPGRSHVTIAEALDAAAAAQRRAPSFCHPFPDALQTYFLSVLLLRLLPRRHGTPATHAMHHYHRSGD